MMRRALIKPIEMMLLGMLGMGVFQIGYHVWKDHQRFHAIVNAILAQQREQPK